jgi:N-acetylglutamate synthase-like GNAT family acetyltransferase
MNQREIIFRRAKDADVDIIWQLLHADGRMQSEVYIREHLDRIYLLLEDKKVLGALCGIPRTHQVEIAWLVIHPFYPESVIAEIMIHEFQGIYCRCYERMAHRRMNDKIIKRLLGSVPQSV